MVLPNIKEEKKLFSNKIFQVAGVDEVGRGCLAGPVIAGAVMITSPDKFFKNFSKIKNVRDSKLLSPAARIKVFNLLVNTDFLSFSVGISSNNKIDECGIQLATKLAMHQAICNLPTQPEFILIDGNFTLPNLSIPQKAIIGGDRKVFLISAASIIAKVTRDNLMKKLSIKYPLYGFDCHKGYGTKKHYLALKKNGPCKIHRISFNLVNNGLIDII